MREPWRSSVARVRRVRRHADHDAAAARRALVAARRPAPARSRSRLSATSRSASSRRVEQVLVLEEVLERPGDLVGRVDLAGAQPLEQVLDGEVEVHDLVGLLEEAVGDGLADRDAGGALDQVLEALEVLDVERADHVDARRRAARARPGSASCCGCRARWCARSRRRSRPSGLRARTASRSISSTVTPRYSTLRARHHLEPVDRAPRSRRGRASRRSRARRRRRAAAARGPPRACGRSCRRRRRSRCRA